MGWAPSAASPVLAWVGSLCLPMARSWTQGQPSADLHQHPCQGRARGHDLATRGVGQWRERPRVRLPVLHRPAGARTQGAQ